MPTLTRRVLAAVFRPIVVAGLLARLLTAPVLAQPYDPAASTLQVMSWNVEWMFDDYLGDNRSSLAREQSAPSREFWEAKLNGVAEVLAASRPDIVALQEIEGGQTLQEIIRRLKSEHQLTYRSAFIEGSDSFTEQDVGFLIRGGLVSYRRHEQSQAMFDSQQFYNVSKHLIAELRWSNTDSPLTVMNVHLRARPEAEDLRIRQAKLARHWLEPALQANHDVILLGDFNSEHRSVAPKSDATVQGEVAVIVGGEGQVPLVDLLQYLPNPQQSTHAVLQKQFDRLYVSTSLINDDPGQDWSFESIAILTDAIVRGQPDGQQHWHERLTMPIAELDLSDHFPIIATFRRK